MTAKLKFIAAVFAFSLTANASDLSLLSDPIRIVDGKLHDLRPLFSWKYREMKKTGYDKWEPQPRAYSHWVELDLEATSTIKAGITCYSRGHPVILLTNYPKPVPDAARFSVFAMKRGTHKDGGNTYQVYDYGNIPKPGVSYVKTNALNKSLVASTNQPPSLIRTNTASTNKARTSFSLKEAREKTKRE